MRRTFIWRIVSGLHWLACRALKRSKERMPVDDDSTCYYRTRDEEKGETTKFVGLPDDELDIHSLDIPDWNILDLGGGTILLRKEPQLQQRGSRTESSEQSMPPFVAKERSPATAHSSSPETRRQPPRAQPPTPQDTDTQSLLTLRPLPPTPAISLLHPSLAAIVASTTPTTASRRNRTSRTPPPLCTAPLNPETLKLLLDTFDRALAHTHYAVCGHAALMVWGYYRGGGGWRDRDGDGDGNGDARRYMPCHVGVVCPEEDRQVILTWARAAGWYIYPPAPSSSSSSSSSAAAAAAASSSSSYSSPRSEGDEVGDDDDGKGGGAVIGVPIPGSRLGSTEVWGFKLRTVASGEMWARLARVRPCAMAPPYLGWAGEMMRTEAQVMAMPTLVNEFARAWYSCAVRGDEGGGERERHIAGLIMWLLRQLAKDNGRWRLPPRHVPCVVYGKFLDAFVVRYPESLDLLERWLHGTP